VLWHRHRRHVGCQPRQARPGRTTLPGIGAARDYTIFAEGCRGQPDKRLLDRFPILANGADAADLNPPGGLDGRQGTLGNPPEEPQARLDGTQLSVAMRATPMRRLWGSTTGAKFCSRLCGGVDYYRNPWLSPFEEMQRLKDASVRSQNFAGGRRIGLRSALPFRKAASSHSRKLPSPGRLWSATPRRPQRAKIKAAHRD